MKMISVLHVRMHLMVYAHTHTQTYAHTHTHFLKSILSLLSPNDSNLACRGEKKKKRKREILEFLSSVYAEFSMEKPSQEQNVLSF